jgi:hypothetical protein
MENDEPQLALPQLAAGAPPAGQQQVKLPPFWPEDPASWFRLAEGQFALRHVADLITRYYHVLAALSVDSVCLVRHVLHKDTGPTSYDQLRTSLMASHSLSNYQKMERMMRLPLLSPQAVCDVGRDAGVLPGQRVLHRRLRLLIPSAATA